MDNPQNYSKVIIHAGGSIENCTYTNSLEAIQKNILKIYELENNTNILLCELDCCKIKDSYILAHDGLENSYGLNENFNNYYFNDLTNIKLFNKFTPLFFKDLYTFINTTNIHNVRFIIDSKNDLDDEFILHIKQEMKEHFDKIILQVYKKEDIIFVKNNNICCLYALWKYNCSAFNQEIENNLEYIIQNKIKILGISLYFGYLNNEDEISKENLYKLQNYNLKIFIHGENNYENCLKIIKNNFGLFAHYPETFYNI